MRDSQAGAVDNRTPRNGVNPDGDLLRGKVRHIDVGQDWRRCGADEGGCGVLLPITQHVCPRCGQISREDLISLDVRRLIPTHDGYELAVAVLRGTWRTTGPSRPLALTRAETAPKAVAASTTTIP
jgi:hypothetical protein